MNQRSRLFIYVAAGLVLTLLAFALHKGGGLELKIVPVKGGPPLLVLPLEPGERFTLHYTIRLKTPLSGRNTAWMKRGVFTLRRSAI